MHPHDHLAEGTAVEVVEGFAQFLQRIFRIDDGLDAALIDGPHPDCLGCREVLVVEVGRVAGLVRRGDIVRWLALHASPKSPPG